MWMHHPHTVSGCLPLHIVGAVLFCFEPQTTYSNLLLCSIKGSNPRIFSIRPVAIISLHVLRSHQEANYPACHILSWPFPCPASRDMNCSWDRESPHLSCKSRSLCNAMASSWPMKSQANLTDLIVFQFQICMHGRLCGDWIVNNGL